MIEVVSGLSLDNFLEKELFKPLGMADTGFSVPTKKLNRLSALYSSLGTAVSLGEATMDRKLDEEWDLIRIDGQTPAESAWAEGKHCPVLSGGGIMGYNCGGLVSTMNDQARLFLMVANGGELPGGPRILRQETVNEMVACDWLALPTCLGAPQTNKGYAGVTAPGLFGWNALGELGTEPCTEEGKVFEEGEYGYAGIAETFWSVNPRRELIILWFTQQVDNFSWSDEEANIWTAARKAVRSVRPKKVEREGSRLPATVTESRSRSPPHRRLSGKTCRTPLTKDENQ